MTESHPSVGRDPVTPAMPIGSRWKRLRVARCSRRSARGAPPEKTPTIRTSWVPGRAEPVLRLI